MADGAQTKALTGLAAGFMGVPGGGGGGIPAITSSSHSDATSGGGVFTVENGGGGLGLGAVRHWPWYAWGVVGLVVIVWLKNRKG